MRALLLLPLLATAATLAAPRERAPRPGDPAALFRARCTSCHDAHRVFHRAAGRDEWRAIVERMRTMPQSGIAPEEAPPLVDYLVAVSSAGAARPAPGTRIGGPAAFGDDWIAVLETAAVRDGTVRLGGVTYEARLKGLEATLSAGGRRHVVSLTETGALGCTSRIAAWRAGEAGYEVHLALYEAAGASVRVARALRRAP